MASRPKAQCLIDNLDFKRLFTAYIFIGEKMFRAILVLFLSANAMLFPSAVQAESNDVNMGKVLIVYLSCSGWMNLATALEIYHRLANPLAANLVEAVAHFCPRAS